MASDTDIELTRALSKGTIAGLTLPDDERAPVTFRSVADSKHSEYVVLSHSINSTFDSCPRRFEFQHVYNVGAMGGDSGYAADVGTGLHEAVQAWAQIALAPNQADSNMTQAEREEAAVDAGFYAFVKWWPWVAEEEGTEAKLVAVTQRSFERALEMYIKTIEDPWWNQWELAETDDGEAAIEIPWRIIHEDKEFIDHRGDKRTFVTQGKIDFILRHKETGEHRVVDLKTTNKAAHQLDAAFRFSGQGGGYAMVLAEMLGIPWREEGLTVTYLGMVFGTLSEGILDPIPMTFTYSPADIEDMLLGNEDRIEQMIKYGNRGWWPRRSGGCEAFGRICPFFSVCHRRDSSFIDQWLAFSEEYNPQTRIYEPKWILHS